ncbi:MAG: hypothetical protein V4736_05680 [Bdellovibrionota bacterium]
MKNIFAFLLSVTLITSTAGADYQGELHGENQTQREVIWIWRHLGEMVISCAAAKTECQSPEIKAVVEQLKTYIPYGNSLQQTEWDKLLEFVSEKEQPQLFQTQAGEVHRIAVTETRKFAKVFVNSDRKDIGYETWIAVLAHEAVHHLGYVDDEKRLPDQVGAEILKHFKSQRQVSSLEQFKLPQSSFVTFNSQAPNMPSFTLLSAPERSGDMSWNPHQLMPICNMQEKLVSQFVTAPAWRVNRIRPEKGDVRIRGAGYAKTVCQSKLNSKIRVSLSPLNASVNLQYPAPLDLENWKTLTPTRVYLDDEFTLGSDYDYEVFGHRQTFVVLSSANEKAKLNAGDVWKTRMTVQSLDGFIPNGCDLYVAGATWSYITRDGIPAVSDFHKCTLTTLGNNQYQVDGEFQLPPNAKPDRYYVPVVGLSTATEVRSAVPIYPTFVEVLNPTALKPAVIHGMKIHDLPAATSLGTLALTNSYKTTENKVFQISFVVEGSQQITDMWFDIDIWYLLPTEFGILHGTGATSSWPQHLIKEEVVGGLSSTQVKLTFLMPGNLSGAQIAAMKFRRFYMRTSDFSWVEIEIPGLHDHMVINEKYGN